MTGTPRVMFLNKYSDTRQCQHFIISDGKLCLLTTTHIDIAGSHSSAIRIGINHLELLVTQLPAENRAPALIQGWLEHEELIRIHGTANHVFAQSIS